MSSGHHGPSTEIELSPSPGIPAVSAVTSGNPDDVRDGKNYKHRQHSGTNSRRNGSNGHISRVRALTNASKDSGVSLNSCIDRFDADRNNHRDGDVKTVHNANDARHADSNGRGIEKHTIISNGGNVGKINSNNDKNTHNANNSQKFHNAIQKDINIKNGKNIRNVSKGDDGEISDNSNVLIIRNGSNGCKAGNGNFQTIDEMLTSSNTSPIFSADKSNNRCTPQVHHAKNGRNIIKPSRDSPKFAFGDNSSDEEEKEDEEEEKKKKVDEAKAKWAAPDGGFGWVVVMSSFTISMLVDGVCFSFGLFVDEFKDVFNTDNATVSWIGSVLNGTYMFVGPLVGALCNVYGCRPVAFAGVIISSVAIFVSTFSQNVIVLILTFGFVGGFGFGMMYLPAIVMVGYYFQKRRALATGIACCGSGMGAFLVAPLSQLLLEEFGWQGAFMILSGMVFNGCMFTLFYRPLPLNVPNRSDEEAMVCKSTPGETEADKLLSCQLEPETPDGLKGDISMPSDLDIKTRRKAKSSTALINMYGKSPQCLSKEYHGRETRHCVSVARLAQSVEFSSSDMTPRSRFSWLSYNSDTSIMKPLERKDIFYSGSLSKFPEEICSMRSTGTRTPSQRSIKSIGKDLRKKDKKRNKWSKAFRSIFDVTLLKSPTFIIYGLSCFLCMMGFFVPFIYLPTHAMAKGVEDQQAAFLISIIGITNIIARVTVGFISDMPWADCLLINNLALVMGGVATAFVPFYLNYLSFCVYCAVFGVSIAVFVSLRSIIMVELMGLERLTTAFGFVVMCQGASSFIGAPIAGAVSDITGSYDYAFYMAGAIFVISGLICLPLRRIARWEGLLQGSELDVKPTR